MFQYMSMSAGVEIDGDQAAVVKRAGPDSAEALRREGERLERASHPGVVQVLSSTPTTDGWELRLAHAGRPLSVARTDAFTVAQTAGLAAAVASTLADLHQLGVVHGRIDASHVLVGDHGRPVLCGFGDGSTPASPEDDVSALGTLLVGLLGSDDDGEPIPDRRWRLRRTWSGWERRALLLLADQACAEPASHRPSARRLAAAITESVPSLVRPPIPSAVGIDAPSVAFDPDVDPIESLRASMLVGVGEGAPRPRALMLGVLGALLIVVAGLRMQAGDAEPMAERLTAPTPPSTSPEARPATPTTTDQVRTAVPVAGSLLEVGGRRYRVGQEGDELLVEDWDCDGTPTPALLRPATGEVYVFHRWIERDQVAVKPVLQVSGAQALVSETTASGCPSLAVRSSAGALVPVIEGSR